MFTGIIQTVGTVKTISRVGGDSRLRIEAHELPADALELGASIAVNGVCLTVIESDAAGFSADVSLETLACTTAKNWRAGEAVNLEPALQLAQRLGGHLVSGHIDGVGQVERRESAARSVCFAVRAPAELARYIAQKGSIAIDGTSLTVNRVEQNLFEVNIVPHTLSHTIMAQYRSGSEVNLEVDLLARYLERLLQGADASGVDSAMTLAGLNTLGYE
ncbi:MAG: riboflavin synthase [Gammaproteobacteria bacterium]|nr:riboflavin synthase [Gammaproteobacteria bacterium]